MTEAERIKEIIKKDKNFCKSFLGVKNVKTAIKIAQSQGFGITKDDILEDTELQDAILDAVSGGNIFKKAWKWFKKNPVKSIATIVCPPVGIAWEAAESIAEKASTKNITNVKINNNQNITEINGNNNNVGQSTCNS